MESKLNLVKTLLNSIVTRWKLLEKLDMNAKGIFEDLINMQDQMMAIKKQKYDDNLYFAEIDDLAQLKISIEKELLFIQLCNNNNEYFEIIEKIQETFQNLNKILQDQKFPSSKAGQLCIILDRIQILINQLKQNHKIRSTIKDHNNYRYALLNYLYKPIVDDFSPILDILVQF
ncbi:unnamed protein product [Paramecium primaurelia]|uniref:Uncharacterized protein n=1 Tax=Paramecium primaurelia TaxID=5886 RepID=A0A8S1L2C1_PARPR|nr:unnamed protein product [Paramecium primaurelia]